ncbi:MAG TPA: ubiquinol-cytochrome c reductase iron-sulfur subunit [Gammaproteobacteria bacterium]|nr:ubiquinol-cytochrome c reductase iron-sulfur subunit [Gammaproteobacteria bacterium]
MSNEGVDIGRRRFLTAATSVVGAVGVGAALVPFISSMNPSARAQAAGAPIEADISKLEKGALLTVEWRGKPIWIVNRTKQNLEDLPKNDKKLKDPKSEVSSQQPKYCVNEYRSIKPEYLVLIGICTHLGCSPTYRPQIAPEDLGPDWLGGWLCPCHGSRFDLAGRVFDGVPAPTNLVVPPYRYLTDTRIRVGEDQGAA